MDIVVTCAPILLLSRTILLVTTKPECMRTISPLQNKWIRRKLCNNERLDTLRRRVQWSQRRKWSDGKVSLMNLLTTKITATTKNRTEEKQNKHIRTGVCVLNGTNWPPPCQPSQNGLSTKWNTFRVLKLNSFFTQNALENSQVTHWNAVNCAEIRWNCVEVRCTVNFSALSCGLHSDILEFADCALMFIFSPGTSDRRACVLKQSGKLNVHAFTYRPLFVRIYDRTDKLCVQRIYSALACAFEYWIEKYHWNYGLAVVREKGSKKWCWCIFKFTNEWIIYAFEMEQETEHTKIGILMGCNWTVLIADKTAMSCCCLSSCFRMH